MSRADAVAKVWQHLMALHETQFQGVSYDSLFAADLFDYDHGKILAYLLIHVLDTCESAHCCKSCALSSCSAVCVETPHPLHPPPPSLPHTLM